MQKNEIIRAIEEKDLDEILALEQSLFHSAWDEKQFLYEWKENQFAQLYALVIDQEIVGYLDFWITFDMAQLAKIAVKKTAQKKGYAKKLMQFMKECCVKEGCETISLEVRVSNEAAIALYEKMSFEKVTIRKNYYQDGEDAYLMICPIMGGSI